MISPKNKIKKENENMIIGEYDIPSDPMCGSQGRIAILDVLVVVGAAL